MRLTPNPNPISRVQRWLEATDTEKPLNAFDVPAVIDRVMNTTDAHITARCKYLVLFGSYVRRVTSGELYWR